MVPEPQPTANVRAQNLESYTLRMTGASSSLTLELPAFRNRFRSLSQLSNHLVVAQLLQLNQQNQRLEAELLLFLVELDRRQLYREQAVASAFEYCVSRLGYSEDVAWKRVGASRLMRRFPRIYELLTEGRIHLTALMLVKPHLTEANHESGFFWPVRRANVRLKSS